MQKPRIYNVLPQFLEGGERRAAAAAFGGASIIATAAAVRTPVDTSTLLNGRYTLLRKDGTRVVATIGYMAEYAAAVHEALGKLKGQPRPKRDGKARGVYWGPHAEPQFLLKAAESVKPQVDAFVIAKLRG